jgi:hypothetical protein
MNLETEITWEGFKSALVRDPDIAAEDFDTIIQTVEAFLLPAQMLARVGSLSNFPS